MARWTRNDYEAVARVICHRSLKNEEAWGNANGRSPHIDVPFASYREALRDIAVDLSEMYEADNPRFDVARFMKACGFDLVGDGTWS